MNYFYHGVPNKLIGNSLMPLCKMKNQDTNLYDLYKSKYTGREEVIKQKIPLLNCFWDEVVQVLPLNPAKLFNLQLKLGLISKLPTYSYFKIDPNQLNKDNAVIYFKTAPGDQNVVVKWLKDVNLDSMQEVPLATINYYKSLVGTKETVFNYQFVPHVLYKGCINIPKSKIFYI